MKAENEYIERIGNRRLVWDSPELVGGIINLPDSGINTIIVSRDENGYEHVSVAPLKKNKLPSWEDMCYLKNIFWGDEEECYQIMPKKSEYVNLKQNCLHLWKPIGKELKDLVGN